ncbi:MAG: sigma-70 family RNA polymerase sigma factor [Catalinimonas sp.]
MPHTVSHQEILTEEAQLIVAAQRDPAAFEVLYNRHYETIFRYVLRRTYDEELAADLTGQTFLKAMTNLPRFEYRGTPLLAWLYRIAGNEVRKHYRQHKQAPVFSADAAELARWLPAETPDELVEERLALLSTFLERLSEDEVLLLQLRFFEEKSFQEIAYLTDLGESAAKMRVYRTLARLRKMFDATPQ